LLQEVASQLRSSYYSLLDFICTVSCERRWPYINRLFTNNSLNVMRMAVACYALQWNGTYKFSQLLNLLQTLLGERYKTLVTSVTRLVIVLANDEVSTYPMIHHSIVWDSIMVTYYIFDRPYLVLLYDLIATKQTYNSIK
jgi:hypothetical protein